MKYRYSIIIPVYNVESYIEKCVESFECQSFKDYQLILVDDGSVDKSGDVCDQLQNKFDNIVVLHKENGGLADARNYGLDYANGEYVLFVDSDDTVTTDYFEFLNRELHGCKPDLLKFGFQVLKNDKIISNAVPYYNSGVYSREKILDYIVPGVVGPEKLFSNDGTALLSACVCAYSYDFINEHKLHFTSERKVQNEDYLFNYEALLCATSVKISTTIHYNYHVREGSLTRRYVPDMCSRKKNLVMRYKELLNNSSLFERYEYRYYNQVIVDFYECLTNECNQYNSNKKLSFERMKEILKTESLKDALMRCNLKGCSNKGKIIYYLMRYKCIRLFYYLYRLKKMG